MLPLTWLLWAVGVDLMLLLAFAAQLLLHPFGRRAVPAWSRVCAIQGTVMRAVLEQLEDIRRVVIAAGSHGRSRPMRL